MTITTKFCDNNYFDMWHAKVRVKTGGQVVKISASVPYVL